MPLPPPPEQQRIVAALEEQFSRLDAAEAALQEAIRRLELLRRSAVETWLGAQGSIHWTTLGDIAEVVGGVTKDSKRQRDPRLVVIPYLRVANVQRGYLDPSEIATSRVTPERLKALRLEPGDILFNEGGDRDKLGRSLASISLTALKAFPVPSLPLPVQRETVARVERVGSLVDSSALAIATGLRRSAGLRRSILERAFTGRLVPQDPSDEPASELVERIRAGRDGTPTRRRGPRRADTVSS